MIKNSYIGYNGANRGLRRRWFLLPILLTICLFLQNASLLKAETTAPSPDEILETMTAFDKAFKSSFTATGTSSVIPSRRYAWPAVPATWKLSMDGDRTLLIMNTKEIVTPADDKPMDVPKKLVASTGISLDKTTPGIPAKRIFFLGPKTATEMSGYAGAEHEGKTPDQIGDGAMSWVIRFTSPKDPALTFLVKKTVWSMGRGFSEHIKEFIEIDDVGDGKFVCKGIGTGLGNISGSWEVTVDTNSGYLVRSARFIRKGHTEPSYEIQTSGTKRAGGQWVAESSLWSDRFIGEGVKELPQSVEKASPEPDMEFFQKIEQSLLGPYPGDGVVIDTRLKPIFTQPFRKGYRYSDTQWWEKHYGESIASLGKVPARVNRDTPTASADKALGKSAPSKVHSEARNSFAANRPRETLAQGSSVKVWWYLVAVIVLGTAIAGVAAYTYIRWRQRSIKGGSQ